MQARNTPLLSGENIVLGQETESPEDAIVRCGRMLVDAGYVRERYIEGMLARDRSFSTAIGNLIAIPHGEMEYKSEIIQTGLSVLTYPGGIDWNGKPVRLVIGIAAKGDEHLQILENIVDKLEDEADVARLVDAADRDEILRVFTGEGREA